MIRRRPVAVYRVIDEEELLSGELLPADGVELSPEWAARLSPGPRFASLRDLRRLAPLAVALAVTVAALGLVAARWALPAAARTSTASQTSRRRVAPARTARPEVLRAARAGRRPAIDRRRSGARVRPKAPPRATRAARPRVAPGSRSILRSLPRTDAARPRRPRRDRARMPVSRARRLAATPVQAPAVVPAAQPTAPMLTPSAPARTPVTNTPSASPATEFGFER